MEIELELEHLWVLIAILIAVALVGFGALGRVVTPNPPRVLTWSDWRFMEVQREYRRELAELRQDGQTLTALLASKPSIETAWKAQEILKRVQGGKGLPVLEARREAVAQAAQAVMDWAGGTATKKDAVKAVKDALERLQGE